MFNTHIRVLVCIASLGLGTAQIAQAQATQTSQGQPQPGAQAAQPPSAPSPTATQTVTSADVTDQEVEQFAKSYEAVAQIQKDTAKDVESATDSTVAAKVKQEANQKMAEAVQSQGMKVERFNLIARSLNEDATLKQRIQQKLQELRQPA